MTRECQHSSLVKSAQISSLSTTSCCCLRATLSSIVATPVFLGHRPPSHPICKSCIAVIWCRGGSRRSTPTCLLTGAALSVNPAAPLLLWHAPAGLPVRESVSTIVWVRWGGWRCWHHWWQDWHHWWHDRLRWRRSGRATAVVDSAAPLFLVSCPSVFCIHCAIEWVHWPRRYRACRWKCTWWCRRWCGRWCGRWRWWNCHRWFWQSCGWPCGRASPAHSLAAEILLSLGPRCLPHGESSIAVVRE